MTPRAHLYVLLAPWVALIALGASFERPEFRPYELLVGRTHFRPSTSVEMDAYGALAYRLHAPEMRQWVHNTFTTDSAGLRNPPFSKPPRIVVVGDSFAVGVGSSDDQTIPALMTKRLGEPVYNYGTRRDAAQLFLADPVFARLPPRVVIYAMSARTIQPLPRPRRAGDPAPPPPPPPAPVARTSTFLDDALRPWRRLGAPIPRWLTVAARDNGLKKRSQRLYYAAERAVFGFPQRIEVDGGPALILTPEEQYLDQTPQQRKLAEVVETWKAYAEANALRGTQVVFAPLPETGDLYLDAFPETIKTNVVDTSFLDAVFEGLNAAGLKTYDVRPQLRAHRTPYLFLRDDTHYAPHTNARVAEAFTQVVRPLLAPTETPP
ncbi:MAG: hypothetical protein RIT81_09030 [Deltaproteobacteria bacterium]